MMREFGAKRLVKRDFFVKQLNIFLLKCIENIQQEGEPL